MLKIRLSSESETELLEAVQYFQNKFPTMNFSKPRLGSNPKYQNDPKYFSYGQPRQKNGKPRRINFKSRKN